MSLLPIGSRVGIVAPCHTWNAERYEAGRAWLEEVGYETVEFGLGPRHRRYAGTDAHRTRALVEALSSEAIDGVWGLRGGSGVTRILHDIPWEDLPSKPIIGFSDLTPLLDRWAVQGHVAVHGPVVHSLSKTAPDSLDHLLTLLDGGELTPLQGDVLVPGEARGALRGGNLALVAATCGTDFQLDGEGAILVLEDIGEAPYKIERMLAQLRDSGVFDGLAGVALGEFAGCEPPRGASWTLREAFEEWFGALGIPVVADLPIGHGARNHAFVVGREARLSRGRLYL